MHRILPEIQIIFFDKFSDLTTEFWKKYLHKINKNIILKAQYWFETGNIGGGCPPIKTKYGWLVIYHAVENSRAGHIYRAGAALLDLADPTKTIGRLIDPLFSPSFSYERNGIVDNVVFPTAAFIVGDRLHIYHGAGDKVIAMKSVNFNELISALLNQPATSQPKIKNLPQPNTTIFPST
jgi:predicted GH43/DUF377 family glycosyl hydrolase